MSKSCSKILKRQKIKLLILKERTGSLTSCIILGLKKVLKTRDSQRKIKSSKALKRCTTIYQMKKSLIKSAMMKELLMKKCTWERFTNSKILLHNLKKKKKRWLMDKKLHSLHLTEKYMRKEKRFKKSVNGISRQSLKHRPGLIK